MRAVRIPCRRWVGMTPTMVTPAVGTGAGPGTVSSMLMAPPAATTRSPSAATKVRSTSRNARLPSIWVSVGWLPNAAQSARRRAGTSSAVAGRMVHPMPPVYRGGAAFRRRIIPSGS